MQRLLSGACIGLEYRAVAHALVVAQDMAAGLWGLPYSLGFEMEQQQAIDDRRQFRLLASYIHLMVWTRLSSCAWVHWTAAHRPLVFSNLPTEMIVS